MLLCWLCPDAGLSSRLVSHGSGSHGSFQLNCSRSLQPQWSFCQLGFVVGGFPFFLPFSSLSVQKLNNGFEEKTDKRCFFTACALPSYKLSVRQQRQKFFTCPLLLIPSLALLSLNHSTAFSSLRLVSTLTSCSCGFDTNISWLESLPTWKKDGPSPITFALLGTLCSSLLSLVAQHAVSSCCWSASF